MDNVSDVDEVKNESAHGEVRSSPREAKPTQAFLEWECTQREQNFKTSVSTWRRSANKLQTLICDSREVLLLRKERDSLNAVFDRVATDYQLFNETLSSLGRSAEAFVKYDQIEQDNSQLNKDVSSRIREIEQEELEIKSKGSLASGSSKRSRISKASSQMSNVSKRVDAAAEAAMLKAKMQFLDVEAEKTLELEQNRLELEKARAMRDLGMAEAKLKAIIKTESLVGEIDKSEHIDVPTVVKSEYVENYLRSQSDNVSVARPQSPVVVDKPATYPDTKLTAESKPFAPRTQPHDHYTQQPLDSGHEDKRAFSTGIGTPEYKRPLIVEQHELGHLVKSFADQITLGRLPTPEPGLFAGDPLKYPAWKSAFGTLIEQKGIPPAERIYFLQRYLGGPAKEAVEGYFFLTTDTAYDEAKQLLDERYGDSFTVANAFRDKLDNWPKIPARDGASLRKFADFLRQCDSAMQLVPSLSVLSDDRENQKILSKLPEWLVLRWLRVVSVWKEQQMFPPFHEFVAFVVKEAEIACSPLNPQKLAKPSERQPGRYERSGKSFGVRSLSTEAKESPDPDVKRKALTIRCFHCEKGHHVSDCRGFSKLSMQDKRALIREKGLCFGCLDQGHRSKFCKHRMSCDFCSKRHPSCLHEDSFVTRKSEADVAEPPVKSTSSQVKVSHLSDTGSMSKCSMIVPVWLSHAGNPNKEELVYALLDTQSDTTFILDSTREALGITGPEVKLVLSTMSASNQLIYSQKIDGLAVRAFDSTQKIKLPPTYSREIMPANRQHIPTPEIAESYPHLQQIATEMMPLNEAEVGLLIGYNCPRALVPRDVIPPLHNEPYAQRTDLGWGIVGIVGDRSTEEDAIGHSHRILTREIPTDLLGESVDGQHSPTVVHSFRNVVKEVFTPLSVAKMLERDFNDTMSDDGSYSVHDRLFLEKISRGIRLTEDKHYEMPLPFKESSTSLPNNKPQAIQRLNRLKERFQRDDSYRNNYIDFMQKVIQSGFAEAVPDSEIQRNDGGVWYIPHHGVYHAKKPGKIRVVFDCSASYQGQSLNGCLLQGPDLTNSLVGVLCRFRQEHIAFMCDIEQMFFQFQVCPEHRDFLRFLWWKNNDTTAETVEMRMTVHLFGAVSSPACANFGLKETANENEEKYGKVAADFIRRDFYVDDGLKSVTSVQEAIDLIQDSKNMCSERGLRLHKFVSNSKEVLSAIPAADHSSGVKDLDLTNDPLPVERALGVQWCVELDAFEFRIVLKDQPLTRRGILSTVSSIYDPLGFVAPIVLVGKQILQSMCRDGNDWDCPLPDNLRDQWVRWRSNLILLQDLRIPRCFKPKDFGPVTTTELHHFSDASSCGYGQCSYLRLVNDKGEVHCSFVMGKARVSPLKAVTIPRLELAAAVVSTKVSSLLNKQLELDICREVFWTDSQIVLGYITNDARRFHVYVANRIQQIRDVTQPEQWRHVPTESNPADEASRGMSAKEFVESSKWIDGPDFLWEQHIPDGHMKEFEVNTDDPEVRKVKVAATHVTTPARVLDLKRLEYFSQWSRLLKAMAVCLRFKSLLQNRSVMMPRSPGDVRENLASYKPVQVDDIAKAETEVVKLVQKSEFGEDIQRLESRTRPENIDRDTQRSLKKTLQKTSQINRLDPYLDDDGVLRVGGRLKRAVFSECLKHPVVLPRRHHVTTLVIRHFHEKIGHQGRGMTTNQIRANGFWIVGCSAAVSTYIYNCVGCRKLRHVEQGQKMAELPEDRLTAAPPFTYCAVDLFGPWIIRDGRKTVKRYGVLFTCLSCRAVHIETANSLETDSFINALRRFVSIRGPIRQLRSDQGTNFVGAKHELRKAVEEMDQNRVQHFLLGHGCDFFPFKMNVPSSSHMGGVWERQIRTVRSVLEGLLYQHGTQLDDESLRTLLLEASAIVNSRPLTTDNLNDPNSLDPLTPNQLLTQKSKIILPPPGQFQREDLYCRKRWRRVQHLANEFWCRWRKEYMQVLQTRTKWRNSKRNIQLGDVVLIKDESPRNQWRLARVIDREVDKDQLVRKVKLEVATHSLDNQGRRLQAVCLLERPIHKLVLLLENELH